MLLAICGLAFSPAPSSAAAARERTALIAGLGSTAIQHVNVIPMTGDVVLADYTVLIRDGRIADLGPSKTFAMPRGATVIDAGGRYLLPGLYDCDAEPDDASLPLFVASGVTAVRSTSPNAAYLLWLRDAIARREVFGPRLHVVGPAIGGPGNGGADVVLSPIEARHAVEEAKRIGFDGLAIASSIEPLIHATVVSAAQELGLRISGALPMRVPRDVALASGQRTRERLDPDVDPLSGVATSPDAAAAARADAASGMWIVPALTWHRARGTREPLEALLARPELKFVAARERASWALAYGHSVALPGYPSRGAEETVAQMKRAGVRMLAGTGAGTPFVQPGASLHDELAALVAAGLTRYEALRAATRDAAEALGELASSGTIEAGKRADLVLVDANPILNLAALRTPSAVFLAGEWLTADALRARLETLAAANAAASRRFATFEPLAVSSGYRYARYELRLRGETIGEERLLVGPAADGGRELRSQCDVDGPGATSTELRANFDSQGRGTRVRFTRRAAGIDWSLEASRPPVQSSSLHPWEPTTVRVSGTLPALGSVSLDAIAASGATIAGPELAADLPFALVANFQLLADRVDAISLGTSRLIPLASLITRVEAFGARRVWRESVARVSRIEDATLATVEGSMSGQQFRVEISRPDGTGIERFQMSLGPDGLVHEVRDLDGGFVAKRVR